MSTMKNCALLFGTSLLFSLGLLVLSQQLIVPAMPYYYETTEDLAVNMAKQQLALMERIEANFSTISQRLQTQNRRIRTVDRRTRSLRQQIVTIRREVTEVKQDERGNATLVAFSAYVSMDTETSPVVFDVILLNQGNGYDNFTGVFRAPVSGIYVFIWSVEAFNSQDIGAQLYVDEEVVGHTWSDASADNYDSSTGIVVTSVKRDSRVYVMLQEGTRVDALQSSFSGWLLGRNV